MLRVRNEPLLPPPPRRRFTRHAGWGAWEGLAALVYSSLLGGGGRGAAYRRDGDDVGAYEAWRRVPVGPGCPGEPRLHRKEGGTRDIVC